jgi:5-methylcytosine-specific restriction enzyme A
MIRRIRLSTTARFALLQREKYRCHLCTGLIYIGQAWDISHEIPLELGGADDDQNRRCAHRKCHGVRTATVDLPAIARAKRIEASHHGARVARSPMRGGRNDILKRKMDGTIVFRDTGRPTAFSRRP